MTRRSQEQRDRLGLAPATAPTNGKDGHTEPAADLQPTTPDTN